MLGDRLAALVPFEKLPLAAAAVVLSPFLPMLFMGEEYGEQAPFQYFTSHSDPDLIEAVRKGRAEEFDDFAWQGEAPDPHDEETFRRSKLNWSLVEEQRHRQLRELYRELFRIRRETPSLRKLDLSAVETRADDEQRTLVVRRGDCAIAFNFGDQEQRVTLPFAGELLLDSGASIDGDRLTLRPGTFALMAR
jgi:maltooligosyltrehalose trehalohydrolase